MWKELSADVCIRKFIDKQSEFMYELLDFNTETNIKFKYWLWIERSQGFDY